MQSQRTRALNKNNTLNEPSVSVISWFMQTKAKNTNNKSALQALVQTRNEGILYQTHKIGK